MTPINKALEEINVSTFTNGILDPEASMLCPVMDGGFIRACTAQGCCH
jgi:hypothetical protein